jgi:hypothetical protein
MVKYIYDPTLIGKHSVFDKVMFEKYDVPARDIIKKKLDGFVIDNPDIYLQDLIITEDNYKYKYIELQVCTKWVSTKFPFDNVYVYERKGRYASDTLFITLDKFFTRGVIFDADSFKNCKPHRIKKYSREFVYDIPWNKILPFVMEELSADMIKMY